MPPELTHDIILVFVVIAAAIFLFIVEWLRVDVVAVLIMVALPILGLVSGSEAFSGFASNAVISIIAVIIIGAGLDHTGVVNRVVGPLVKLAGARRWRIVGLLSLTIALISGFMQNIGAAALFLPAVRRISRKTKTPISALLMPVGFSAILGGTITLVGSSPLIMLNDLLDPYKLERFSLFSPFPIGLALVLAGIVYFIVLGPVLLPADEGPDPGANLFDPLQDYPLVGRLFELWLPHRAGHAPTVESLCDQYLVHVVAMGQDGGRSMHLPPDRGDTVQAGSVLAVYGPEEKVREMAVDLGMEIKPALKIFAKHVSGEVAGVVEAIVTPRSEFNGKSLDEIKFRRHHLVTPLAVMREDKIFYNRLPEVVLQTGDAILMHGSWERFQHLRHRRNFIFTHPLNHEIVHPQKALWAAFWFLLAMGLVFFSGLKLSVCLMAGAMGMVLSRVLSMDEAYRSVDWRTVFLLAGLYPLGIATQNSGAAAWVAHEVLHLAGTPSPMVLYLLVGILSTLFTLVISNVGAVVLLVPLVVNLAESAGADPRLAALMVGLATSNSFVLPTHQVNALYMGPGHYTSADFMKVGGGMTVIFLAVTMLMLGLFYG